MVNKHKYTYIERLLLNNNNTLILVDIVRVCDVWRRYSKKVRRRIREESNENEIELYTMWHTIKVTNNK